MRDHLFKAVSIDGKWVEGDLAKWTYEKHGGDFPEDAFGHFILPVDSREESEWIEVHPDTVCEITGLLDINIKKVFEGDIVEKVGVNLNETYYCFPDEHKIGQKYVVCALKSGFTLIKLERYLSVKNDSIYMPNIVGNINNYNFWNGASTGCKVTGNIHDGRVK